MLSPTIGVLIDNLTWFSIPNWLLRSKFHTHKNAAKQEPIVEQSRSSWMGILGHLNLHEIAYFFLLNFHDTMVSCRSPGSNAVLTARWIWRKFWNYVPFVTIPTSYFRDELPACMPSDERCEETVESTAPEYRGPNDKNDDDDLELEGQVSERTRSLNI